jgi:hypothetical protein
MQPADATPAATTPPDPPPERPAASAATRSGRLLGLLRKLVDYAKDFASTLQQRATAPDFYRVAHRFGTADLALILARITNGLRLAAGLEARLLLRADREAKATPTPNRDPRPRPPRAAPPPASPAATQTGNDLSAPLPTAEEIAAALRRRPIGAVLADIARDIGIMPNHPLWRELCLEVGMNGGSFIRLWRDVAGRLSDYARYCLDPCPTGPPPWPVPFPPSVTPAGTGPP